MRKALDEQMEAKEEASMVLTALEVPMEASLVRSRTRWGLGSQLRVGASSAEEGLSLCFRVRFIRQHL